MQAREWVVRGRKTEGRGGERGVIFIVKSSGHQTLQKKYNETCGRERASKSACVVCMCVCERERERERERENSNTLILKVLAVLQTQIRTTERERERVMCLTSTETIRLFRDGEKGVWR